MDPFFSHHKNFSESLQIGSGRGWGNPPSKVLNWGRGWEFPPGAPGGVHTSFEFEWYATDLQRLPCVNFLTGNFWGYESNMKRKLWGCKTRMTVRRGSHRKYWLMKGFGEKLIDQCHEGAIYPSTATIVYFPFVSPDQLRPDYLFQSHPLRINIKDGCIGDQFFLFWFSLIIWISKVYTYRYQSTFKH